MVRLLFIVSAVIIVRYLQIPSPLPHDWTPEKELIFTAKILETPYHNDTKTIITKGRWNIKIRGYKDLKVGAKYQFAGRVMPRVIMGKIVQIEMIDPSIYEIEGSTKSQLTRGEAVLVQLSKWREMIVQVFQKNLPEPYAALAAGILLGVKSEIPSDFYHDLVETGTLHLIAASGYNVNVVLQTVMVPITLIFARTGAIILGLFTLVIYVTISGASPAIIRAALMGSATLVAYYWGRPAEAKRIFLITIIVMLFIDPLLLFNTGFQLSIVATWGLIYLEPLIKKKLSAWIHWSEGPQAYLADYLYPSLAASIATMPIILWTFGRVSWISPIINMLVLPFTPIVMFLSALAVSLSWIPGVSKIVMWLLYIPLWMMVQIILFFG